MNCQRPDLYEFLSTDPALIGFVSSVHPGVFLHVVLPGEGLAAPTAGELLLLLCLRLRLLSVLGQNLLNLNIIRMEKIILKFGRIKRAKLI